MARAGVDTYLIELIGRWGSSAIKRYVQEAGLAVQQLIAARLGAQAAGSSSASAALRPVGAVAAPSASLQQLPAPGAFAALEERLRLLEAALATSRSAVCAAPPPAKRFVANDVTGCVHLVGICSAEVPREAWLTGRCSWRFGLQPHTLLAVRPTDRSKHGLCSTCFPGARRAAAAVSSLPASSGSSSASASESSSGHSA